MASGQQRHNTVKATDAAVHASAGLLHHRRGWIWTLVVSVAGFIVSVWVAAKPATGGTASLLLDLVGLLMLVAFLIALTMVFVITSRLRRHGPAVRGHALAVHRTTRRPVLSHPHDHRRHPVAYAVGMLVLAGWVVGGVVFLPRLVDSVGYLTGAGRSVTFVPRSYVPECSHVGRVGSTCSLATNGVMEAGGQTSPATWPTQVPLNVPFQVREPVWRWALGDGLINGYGTAVGSLFVGLIFEGGAALAVYIAIRPYLDGSWRAAAKPARTRR